MTRWCLDLGLPEVDGLTVLDRWRKEGRRMPVLVLTARDSWSDKVAGLDAGRRRLSRQAVPDRRADRPPARADPPRIGQCLVELIAGDIRPRHPLGQGHQGRRAGEAHRPGV
jgi:two-component system OmpR family response regulator